METAAQRIYLTQYLSLMIIILVFVVGAVYAPASFKRVTPDDPRPHAARAWIGDPQPLDERASGEALAQVLSAHSIGAELTLPVSGGVARGFAEGRALGALLSAHGVPADAFDIVLSESAASGTYRLFRVRESR